MLLPYIYQYILDQGQPFLYILNSTARVDLIYEKMTTFWKVQKHLARCLYY